MHVVSSCRYISLPLEAVEGSKRNMREDLYKKHVSGDPVAARLPYAIVTRLVELLRWKRLELNALVRFTGVTEGNFDSILRRSWVMVFRATFMDPVVFEQTYAKCDPPAGVFPRDSTLRTFLHSGRLYSLA